MHEGVEYIMSLPLGQNENIVIWMKCSVSMLALDPINMLCVCVCVRKSESDRGMCKPCSKTSHKSNMKRLNIYHQQVESIQQKKQNFMSGYDSTVGVAECCTCLFSITDKNSNLSTHTHSNIQTQQGVAHIELWRVVMIVFANPQLTCRVLYINTMRLDHPNYYEMVYHMKVL